DETELTRRKAPWLSDPWRAQRIYGNVHYHVGGRNGREVRSKEVDVSVRVQIVRETSGQELHVPLPGSRSEGIVSRIVGCSVEGLVLIPVDRGDTHQFDACDRAATLILDVAGDLPGGWQRHEILHDHLITG